MKNVMLLDTTVGSMNVGDNIIMKAIKDVMSDLLEENHVRSIPTRTIAFPRYQMRNDPRVDYASNADYKLVCGTNLLKACMAHIQNQWNINIFNYKPMQNAILVGVGAEIGRIYLDPYTRLLYKKVLSSDFIHSARDERTKALIEDLGLKAINTGCPTLWGFNSEFCESIPKTKSDKVVFTFHYGRKDKKHDQMLIDIVKRNYEKVYFFPQVPDDIEYLNTFKGTENITVLPSNLDAYTKLLTENEIDYVGVRLHGGIHAMQHKKRAILLIVDERMRNINNSNNLNCIERSNIEMLEEMINSEFETKVKVDYQAIDQWLGQFNISINNKKSY
jgi:polysaccharide pyruvyl transferase WcaK-like protein